MWLLPSRGRYLMCEEALFACEQTGMTSRAVCIIDSREHLYPHLPHFGDNWEIIRAPWDMAECMRFVLRNYPDEDFYGWIADDMRPRTQGWDTQLEAAAGRWGLATCRDNLFDHSPHFRKTLLCGAMCWGGDLVRGIGFWALPGVNQGAIDDLWSQIMRDGLGTGLTFMKDVLVEHLHWRNGSRLQDATDNHKRDGVDRIKKDFKIAKDWWKSEEAQRLLSSVRENMHV